MDDLFHAMVLSKRRLLALHVTTADGQNRAQVETLLEAGAGDSR